VTDARVAAMFAAAFVLALPAEAATDAAGAAGRILATLERRLPEMTVETQGHFAIRLWRTGADARHLDTVRRYAETLATNLREHAAETSGPRRAPENARLSKKLRRRAEALEAHAALVGERRLLFLLYQAKSLGLDKGPARADCEAALRRLEKVPFEDFYLDPGVLRYNASRTVAAVRYLEFLGLPARREEFEALFRRVFMEPSDEKLGSVEYLNKIYALTHLVIADSDFYQRPAAPEKHGWVLDYFRRNLAEILARTNPDAVAEVGLAFKLAGLGGDPAVARARDYVLARFEAKQGAVLKGGAFDPEEGEHRNVVAYLLFSDWEGLRPGPDLSAVEG
jgi:hypothetical protein